MFAPPGNRRANHKIAPESKQVARAAGFAG